MPWGEINAEQTHHKKLCLIYAHYTVTHPGSRDCVHVLPESFLLDTTVKCQIEPELFIDMFYTHWCTLIQLMHAQ